MSVTTTEHGDAHDGGSGDAHDGGGHHETPAQRDLKERMALWILIGSDALFFVLEIFTWFYLRALNTNGMWRGATCSTANPCTDGLGNNLTHQVAKATPTYSVVVAVLAVAAALLVWAAERSARRGSGRGPTGAAAGLALLALLAALVVQSYQFGQLPFTTIDGAYASTFEFFMGSTLAHLGLLTFLVFGLWNRSRLGRYEDGRWYQVRLVRIFAVWIAVSVCVLTIVMSLFA
jgi:heme/copper-type cytochrome/quinol oxidase subunit 3